MRSVVINPFKPYVSDITDYKGGRAKLSKDGVKVYKLSSNENPLGSSPLALKAIRQHIDNLHEYPPSTDEILRNAVADHFDHALPANCFFSGNSGIDVLEIIVHAFLTEGQECIISNPAFKPYYQFPQKVGAKIIDIPLIGDQLDLDVENILSAINDRTRLLWICSPNNPMGTYIRKAQLERVLDAIPEHVIVVYDEVYHHFVEAEDYSIALPYVQNGHNIIGIRSFSKVYGLAGMRVAYAYSTEKIATYVQKFRRPFHLNQLSLVAALAALQDTNFIQETIDVIKNGKAYVSKELDQIGIKYWPSHTNFITIKPTMDDNIFERQMEELGIMVRRASVFGAPGCIRVTLGTAEANQAYVAALRKILA